jgi:hypothetical protein
MLSSSIYFGYYFVGFCRGVIVLAQKNQPHKIQLLNPLTKTSNTMFEAQMPSVILESVAVMKSPTMFFVSIYYPAEIAWVDESTPTKGIDEDWGEGRFLIEHHSMRCITMFNGEFYALAVNNLEFRTLVCTNNVQLEQALVEKSLLVAHRFGICVAHMGCATNAMPLITDYWWRISICATHMLNISGAYSICVISVLCVAHIAICATNT